MYSGFFSAVTCKGVITSVNVSALPFPSLQLKTDVNMLPNREPWVCIWKCGPHQMNADFLLYTNFK